MSVADQVGLPAAKTCVKRGKLKAPSGARIVSATVKVNGKTKARLKGAKVRRAISLKKLKKTTRVKVTLKLADGRKLTASRAYRACR